MNVIYTGQCDYYMLIMENGELYKISKKKMNYRISVAIGLIRDVFFFGLIPSFLDQLSFLPGECTRNLSLLELYVECILLALQRSYVIERKIVFFNTKVTSCPSRSELLHNSNQRSLTL